MQAAASHSPLPAVKLRKTRVSRVQRLAYLERHICDGTQHWHLASKEDTLFTKLQLITKPSNPLRLGKEIDRARMVASSSEFSTLFAAFDRDSDGRISAAELRLCMRATLGEDVPVEEAEALVASVDEDGDGLLCEAEFVRLVPAGAAEEERHRGLREAFGMYEMEGEGCITPTSLKRMLGRLGSEQGIDDCRAMICRFDLNGDGVLSFDEFKIMMSAS